MSEFKVDLVTLKNQVSALKAIGTDMTQIVDELRNVVKSLSIETNGIEKIKSDLSVAIADTHNEKETFTKLSSALDQIATTYETVESVLISNDQLKSLKKSIVELKEKMEELRKNTKGVDDSCGYSKDPVNLCNGNYVYEKTLLELKAPYPLCFRIFYNSMDTDEGVLGKGWFHDYEIYLNQVNNEHIVVVLEEKCELSFISHDGKLYRNVQNPLDVLTKVKTGYFLHLKNGHQYHFSNAGRLLQEKDELGNSIEFEYDNNNHLTAILSQGTIKLNLTYSEDHRLLGISAGKQRKIQFSYTDHHMTELTYLKEDGTEKLQVYKFGYDKADRLCKLISADNIISLENEYDETNRVTKQTFPDGGIVKYEYLDQEQIVLITEQNQNQIKHCHDNMFRSKEDIDGRGVEKYEYNEWNQKTSYIDRRGNETKFEYDEYGYLTTVLDPCGIRKAFKYTNSHKVKEYTLNGILQMKGMYDKNGNVIAISDALERKHTLIYDDNGRPIKVILPDNSEVDLSYDSSGNLIYIKNAMSIVTEYEYDKWNRVIASIDGNKNRTEFRYNNKDEIIEVINANGEHRTYTYNENGMLVKVTDFNGSVYQTEYNVLNKPAKYIDANGHITELKYDIMWNLCAKLEPNQAVSKYDYDAFGRLIREEDPYGAAIQYEYDAEDNCIKKIGKLGEVYEFEYDALNRLIKTIEPNGQVTSYTYNAADSIIEIINTYGKTKKFEYDLAGQKIKQIDEANNATYYSYNAIGKITKVEDKNGLWISYHYYPGGLLKKVAYSNGKFIDFEYDKNGNLIKQKDQDGYTICYEYDCMNQRVSAQDSDGVEETYVFDSIGNLITRENQGSYTQYEYTATGKLSKVIDPLGNETQYTYDCMDQLTEILQAQQNPCIQQLTVYERDLMGRVIKITDPIGKEEEYRYDAYGHIIQKLDADHYTTSYEYTTYGIPEKIYYGDSKTVHFSYNQLKQLVEIKDWLGITKIEVDELGRAKKITTPDSQTVQYEFGTHGEKKKIIYPDGYQVGFLYNNTLQLTALQMDGNSIQFQYDQVGRCITKEDGNGIHSTYKYNHRGNIVSIVTKEHDQICQTMHYEYDIYNRCISWNIEDSLGKKNHTQVQYDKMGRINEIHKNGTPTLTYTYDGFGNRLSKSQDGICSVYEYNLANQLLSETVGDAITHYAYDGRGNLVKQSQAYEEIGYTYDAMNRLSNIHQTSLLDSHHSKTTYIYNGLGYRVGQILEHTNKYGLISNNESKYSLDFTQPIDNLLMEQQNAEHTHYVWNKGLQMIHSKNEFWSVCNDRLQSPSFISNGNGSIQTLLYDEFGLGEETIHSLDFPLSVGFTGYSKESISSSYFAQAREYMPTAGRFGNKDAIAGNIYAPFTLNRYVYCYNDSINYTDRTGYWFGLDDAIAAGVGAIVGVGAQFVTDTATGFISGDFNYDWEDYVGSAIGGAAGGVTTLYAGPIAGCAVESGASTLISGSIKMIDGKSDQNVGELLIDTSVNTGLGALFGKIVPDLKIPKITKGRGSFASVYKAGLTKISRGIAKRMSLKVIAKGITANLLGGAIATFVSGVTGSIYDLLKDKLKDVFANRDQYIDSLEKWLDDLTAECPVSGK